MVATIDLTSQRFGRLAVLQRAGSGNRGQAQWECVCLCGNVVIAIGCNLRNGHTQSCGCLKRERTSAANTRHGMRASPEYQSWNHAVHRTTNPNDPAWDYYGGRGIDIDPTWVGPGGFEKFFAVLGPRPEGHSLDRIDNNKGYWSNNVRWADARTQSNNRREWGTQIR